MAAAVGFFGSIIGGSSISDRRWCGCGLKGLSIGFYFKTGIVTADGRKGVLDLWAVESGDREVYLKTTFSILEFGKVV